MKLSGGLVLTKKLYSSLTLEVGNVVIRLDIRDIDGKYVSLGILADKEKVRINRNVDRGEDENISDRGRRIHRFKPM